MAQIHVLSKETIDKIAAGEVVERPSSVVKELLENAIDAGSAAVTVEIKEGGISFIRVTDNGCGIDKTQVQKAFLRHATSKIQSAEDLAHIVSLGFRGEALSSISAVSRMELITKTKEDLTGIRYLIEGGEQKELEEIGAPDGTTMIVRNLFFNTPVRKKFLRQPQTEGGYISDLMEHMALSNPQVSFKYINNGQVRFHTSGNGNLQEIIYRIYGRDISAALIPIDFEENGIRMWGYLGKPEINRANRNFEIYFVNGRFIKSQLISKAIEEGYRKYVMQHKFPFVVLHFQIASGETDVNVHPTKMEVRFTNQSRLFDFISGKIGAALHQTELIPEVVLTEPKKEEEKIPAGAVPEPFERMRAAKEGQGMGLGKEAMASKVVAQEMLYQAEPYAGQAKPPISQEDSAAEEASFFVEHRFFKQKEEISSVEAETARKSTETEKNSPEPQKTPDNVQEVLQNRPFQRILGSQDAVKASEHTEMRANVIKASEHILVEKPVQMNFFEEKMLTKEAKNEYQILGQIFDTYWLVAFHDKLFIVDQHAAHEKVKYEHFMKQLEEKRVSSQMVNPPVIITLTGREESVLKEFREIFEEMGFEIEAFGGNEYAIRSVPTDLYGCSESELFTEMLDELSEGQMKGAPNVIRQRIATMACKAAVKGNMSFERVGMEALIDQLLTLEDPYHCPHGRPTIISMSKYEIEKKFKRIV